MSASAIPAAFCPPVDFRLSAALRCPSIDVSAALRCPSIDVSAALRCPSIDVSAALRPKAGCPSNLPLRSIPPTALRLRAPPVHVVTGDYGFGRTACLRAPEMPPQRPLALVTRGPGATVTGGSANSDVLTLRCTYWRIRRPNKYTFRFLAGFLLRIKTAPSLCCGQVTETPEELRKSGERRSDGLADGAGPGDQGAGDVSVRSGEKAVGVLWSRRAWPPSATLEGGARWIRVLRSRTK